MTSAHGRTDHLGARKKRGRSNDTGDLPNRRILPVTEAADARARRFEREVRLEHQREYAIIIDNESGMVVGRRIRGTIDMVQFGEQHQQELTGRVVSHNHPLGWYLPPGDPRHAGIGFSPTDIELFVDFLPAELRAVSPGYLHRLRPRFDENGVITTPTIDRNRHLVHAEILRAFERTRRSILERVVLGEMSEAEATVELNHRAMIELQDVIQVEYDREVLP